ncbi:MAG: hypothetical protein HC830_04615 [Bacteroidetes bacterium]|nr:hypothetical protein [Bacteroidota bacterium]
MKKQTIGYWESLKLPYNKISVPDSGIQNLLNASIRNIYQSIEFEKGIPVVKTGSSSNRQFNIADAAFIIDALTMLNEKNDGRKVIEYLISQQNSDGSFQQTDKDWKATGYALWTIANHARLTGDKDWLESVWPSLEKGFTFLMELTNKTKQQTKSAYAGLIPPGYGSEGQGIDYVHNYWALTGLNSAITAARWVGRNGQAIKWQSQYDDLYFVFLESMKKNMRKDVNGIQYLPARATSDKKAQAQKHQWAFLNAVYPGKGIRPERSGFNRKHENAGEEYKRRIAVWNRVDAKWNCNSYCIGLRPCVAMDRKSTVGARHSLCLG